MKIEELKKIAGIGLIWAIAGGLLWGGLEVDAILVSSSHDLGGVPFLSWVASAWVVLLTIVSMGLWLGVWLWLGGWVMELAKKEVRVKEKDWVAVGGGWMLASVGLGFFGSSMQSWMDGVKIFLMVGAGGLGGGGLLWVLLDWMERVDEEWRKWWKRAGWMVGGAGLLVLLLVVIQGGRVLATSRVGQKLKKEGGEGKNLILVTMEAWREQDFNKKIMPQLSRWSEEGVVFERAYSPAPWTLPSFASMMSGYYPGQLGVSTTDYSVEEIKQGGRLVEGVETLAERLESEGYLTQAFVTNEWLSEERGFDQGWERFVQLEVQRPYHYVFHGKDMKVVRWWKKLGLGVVVEEGWDLLVGEASLHKWGTDAEQVVGLGRNWLLKDPDEPFFLWMHLMDPHAPYQPKEGYGPKAKEISQSRLEKLRQDAPLDKEDVRWREKDKEVYKGLYEGELKYADENLVSRFLRRVEEWGYLDDSVVVITADHGEEFWEHGGLGHATSMYDEQVRVPLMVRGVGVEAGRVEKPVSLVEMKASLLDVLGVEESEKSWWSDDERRVWLEGNGRGSYLKAVVDGRWKLIWDTFDDEYELYDLKTDSEEGRKVVDKYGGVKERLEEELREWKQENEKFYSRLEKGEVEDLGDVVGY